MKKKALNNSWNRWIVIGATVLLGWSGGAVAAIEPAVLRVSSDVEPTTLDWTRSQTSADRFIASFLMRGMLKYDAVNQPVCDLCKSFAVSEGGKRYIFELAAGTEWSDGTRLEAQHFVEAYQRIQSVSRSSAVARQISLFKADGKDRIEVGLTKPLADFPHFMTTAAVFPVRKDLLKGAHDSGEHHASTAVLGPYQLAAWEHGKRIVIEGNPRFKGERPVYRVDFVLGTHAQLLAKFKSGKLDILSNPTGEDLMKLPGQKLQTNPYWATRELRVNVRRSPLSDLGFRRAILHSLDRDSLPAFLKNGERRATGLVPPGLVGYRELALATSDPGLGLKERQHAVPLARAVELTLLARDLDADRRVAEWMSAQLERIRVRILPRIVAPGEYSRALEKGDFDLALETWAFDMASPLEMLRSFETGGAQNRGGWTHVGYDALLGQLTREADRAKASALIDQLTQQVETQSVASIPLGYPTQPFLLGARVVSFAITPFGDPDLVKIELRK